MRIIPAPWRPRDTMAARLLNNSSLKQGYGFRGPQHTSVDIDQ